MADDRPIRTSAQLRNKIGLARIGQDVKLTVQRDGVPATVVVTVAPPLEPSTASVTGNRRLR